MVLVSDGTTTPPTETRSFKLPEFLLLYGALFSAYRTESACLLSFLQSHDLPIERIGIVLSAGTLIRIMSGPVIGRLADQLGARRDVPLR